MEVLFCQEVETEDLEVTDLDLKLESLVLRLTALAAELLVDKLAEAPEEADRQEVLAEALDPMGTVLLVCGNLLRNFNYK